MHFLWKTRTKLCKCKRLVEYTESTRPFSVNYTSRFFSQVSRSTRAESKDHGRKSSSYSFRRTRGRAIVSERVVFAHRYKHHFTKNFRQFLCGPKLNVHNQMKNANEVKTRQKEIVFLTKLYPGGQRVFFSAALI